MILELNKLSTFAEWCQKSLQKSEGSPGKGRGQEWGVSRMCCCTAEAAAAQHCDCSKCHWAVHFYPCPLHTATFQLWNRLPAPPGPELSGGCQFHSSRGCCSPLINGVPAAMGRAKTPVTQGTLLPLHPCLPGRRERADLMHIYAGREMVLCCLPSQKINFTQVPCISLSELGKLWGRKARTHHTHTYTHTRMCVHAPSYENPKTLYTSDVWAGILMTRMTQRT